jgi:Mg2+-importing ATPase
MLGFWQERGAANAVRELLKIVQLRCCLLRDGKEQELPVEQAVPGDLVVLNAGDLIPADCLLLQADLLLVDEAAFTCETASGSAFSIFFSTGKAPLSKRRNVLFMGSHVISGKAKAVVVKTGQQAEFGKIAEGLRQRVPETEFEKGIRHFGYLLMELTLLLVIIIFAVNVLLHKPALDSILFSLALAVGLTPQLLPAIISVNLSVGARTMARQQVIVKRLSSIENFGSMNMLCSDKTGTITEGKVVLKNAMDSEGNDSSKTMQFAWLNASLQQGFVNPIDQAIIHGFDGNAKGYTVQAEVPYDFYRKRLTIQVLYQNQSLALTKGAFDSVIAICNRVELPGGQIVPLPDKLEAIKERFHQMSAMGLRVLGIASKQADASRSFTREDEKDMIFIGFLAFFDPLKKDVAQTILQLNQLGVQLKLITGDNALVAHSLAKQIGFPAPVVLTGKDMREMSEAAFIQQVLRTNIFAEVEPNQKERIIIALKKAGNVVGFIGDGINDAPALHAADVGISVDSAVDVAKEAADIVLLNQSLDVLLTGIVAGRKTFTNTMKYIFMATSANFGNMFSMAGASLLLPFLPLLPKQILLTNLLTDFPEMAIATDKVTVSETQKPHRWDLGFIKRFMLVFGLISSVFDFLTFGVLLYFFHASERMFQTGWLTESVVSATLIVLVVRTRMPFFKNLPGRSLAMATLLVLLFVLSLPFLPFAGLLDIVHLPLSFYGWMLLIVAAYMATAEWAKHLFYKSQKS